MYWLSAEQMVGKFSLGDNKFDFVLAKYVCIFSFDKLVFLRIYFSSSSEWPILVGISGCFYILELPFRFDLVLINLFLARINLSSLSSLFFPKLD
jgi:hypothetical protein